MAASVCMTSSSSSERPKLSPATMERESPDTTPTDTEFRNSPSALPMAITFCPSFILEESPNSRYGTLPAFIFKMAISRIGSRASTSASCFSPSLVSTVYSAAVSETTCRLVTTSPSLETKNPEPPPTSLFSVPFSRMRGIWKLNPPPKGSRKNSSNGSKFSKYCSTIGTSFVTIIETTAGFTLLIVSVIADSSEKTTRSFPFEAICRSSKSARYCLAK